LESAKERERVLTEKLEKEEVLKKDAENNYAELHHNLSLWTGRLVNAAERISSQIAVMDMKSWGFTESDKEATSVRLTKFFKGLIDALKTYHEDRSASFADESRKFAREVVYRVLLKIAHRNPGLDLSGVFRKLPENTDVTAADKIAAPLADKVLLIPRIQDDRRD
jgi:hypothetical protein